ncbi:hypothetical protein [Roseibium algae]|uniref:VCBS repeat-containing protein n=1 Tax=Roseibium algae TaxID=3123038 RepID=A0ABU8TKI2_9HYPH
MTTVWGVVNADGNIKSGSQDRDGNNNFKIVKAATGTYQIQFNSSFSAIPAIIGSQVLWGNLNQSTLDNIVFPDLNKDGATAIVGDASGNPTDRHFSFIAKGPDNR